MSSWCRPSTRRPTSPRLLLDLEERPRAWAGGHVVVVDDGSTDDTAALVATYDGPLPVLLVRQRRNRGPGRAFDRGFRAALELCDGDDDLIVTLEADTTSDLDAVGPMLARARAGADVVLASVHGGGAIVGVGRTGRALARRVLRRAPRRSGSTRAPSRRSSASTARGSCARLRGPRALVHPRGRLRLQGRDPGQARPPGRPRRGGAGRPGRLAPGGREQAPRPAHVGGYARFMARQLAERRERTA